MIEYEDDEDPEFESWDLLNAINEFDDIRTTANDSDINRPPEFRIKLFELHQEAMKIKGTRDKKELFEFREKLEELSDEAYQLLSHAENLCNIFKKYEGLLDKAIGNYDVT